MALPDGCPRFALRVQNEDNGTNGNGEGILKKFGKTIFEIAVSIVLWVLFIMGILVISIFSPSLAHYLWFGLVAFLACVAYLGVKRSIQGRKRLICPNGCVVKQSGSRFCGQCGASLIIR